MVGSRARSRVGMLGVASFGRSWCRAASSGLRRLHAHPVVGATSKAGRSTGPWTEYRRTRRTPGQDRRNARVLAISLTHVERPDASAREPETRGFEAQRTRGKQRRSGCGNSYLPGVRSILGENSSGRRRRWPSGRKDEDLPDRSGDSSRPESLACGARPAHCGPRGTDRLWTGPHLRRLASLRHHRNRLGSESSKLAALRGEAEKRPERSAPPHERRAAPARPKDCRDTAWRPPASSGLRSVRSTISCSVQRGPRDGPQTREKIEAPAGVATQSGPLGRERLFAALLVANLGADRGTAAVEPSIGPMNSGAPRGPDRQHRRTGSEPRSHLQEIPWTRPS